MSQHNTVNENNVTDAYYNQMRPELPITISRSRSSETVDSNRIVGEKDEIALEVQNK